MDWQGKRILVIGLGESGLAMAKWLTRQGAYVRVADSRTAPPNVEQLRVLAPQAELLTGEFSAATFAGIDLIAISPGVAKETPAIVASGLPLVSEIELFAAGVHALQAPAKILAITGSNGKTTTTALTAYLLNAAGVSAVACGNISPAALDALMDAEDAGSLPAVWVLELSSFQLETTHHLNAEAATVLNLSEDHLDRYEGSMANYAAAKSRIFQGKGAMVLNRDDDWSIGNGRCGRTMVTFGLNPAPRKADFGFVEGAIVKGADKLVDLADLQLAGLHKAANAMAALALCEAVGVAPARLIEPLKTFRGLPHRVEQVAERNGVCYVDDSKGTNVGATLAAIEAAIAGCGVPMQRVGNMAEAVQYLAAQAQSGDCVLLSPACASLDMYKN